MPQKYASILRLVFKERFYCISYYTTIIQLNDFTVYRLVQCVFLTTPTSTAFLTMTTLYN